MHSFYVDKYALEEEFDEIANLTGGIASFLDINSENGSKILTDFISLRLLQDIEIQCGGDGSMLKGMYEATFN